MCVCISVHCGHACICTAFIIHLKSFLQKTKNLKIKSCSNIKSFILYPFCMNFTSNPSDV